MRRPSAIADDYAGPPGTWHSLEVIAAVRNALLAARRRGQPFPSAWAAVVLRPASEAIGRDETTTWKAIKATRAGWQRAYEGVPPTPAERAAGRLLLDDAAERMVLDAA